jgi:hypothetical protein
VRFGYTPLLISKILHSAGAMNLPMPQAGGRGRRILRDETAPAASVEGDTQPAGVIEERHLAANSRAVSVARVRHPARELCEKFARFVVKDAHGTLDYAELEAGQHVRTVYMLHNPLVPESTRNASNGKAKTFLQLENAWKTIGVDPSELGLMITELSPLTSRTGQMDSRLPLYNEVTLACMEAALAPLNDPQGGVLVVFGSYARWRWLRHWRALCSSGQVSYDQAGNCRLELVLSSGGRVTVWFADHPSAGWLFKEMVRVMAQAHGRDEAEWGPRLARMVEWYYVESVQPVEAGEFVSLEVQAEDGRFVLADGVITHNSSQDVMREKLLLALREGSQGFGFR